MKKYRVWGIMADRSRSDVDLKIIEEMLLELEAHFGLEQLGVCETKTYPDFIVRETYPPLFGTPALKKKKPPDHLQPVTPDTQPGDAMNIDTQIKKIRVVAKRASLQRVIIAWLKSEKIQLHGENIDNVAMKMMIGAEASYVTALFDTLNRRASFDDE